MEVLDLSVHNANKRNRVIALNMPENEKYKMNKQVAKSVLM